MKTFLPLKGIILFISILLNLTLVVYLSWGYLQSRVYTVAYQRSQESTIMQLIQTAEKCEPFSVYAGETNVQLQMLGCDTAAAAESTETSAPAQ
jgi:hypothetical protein